MDSTYLQQFKENYLQKHSEIDPRMHGCSLSDIAEYEQGVGFPLPQIYKEVLLLSGRRIEENPNQNAYSFPEILEANHITRELAEDGEFLNFPRNGLGHQYV